jgi:cation transport protein ChaC
MTAETLAYLRAREQINGVYRETHATIILHGETPRSVFGTAFVAERAHPSYAGRLPLEHQAELIRAASGKSGPNIDYLLATLSRLDAMGIQEPALTRLITLIGPHFSKRQGNVQRAPGSRRLTNGIQMAARNTPIRAPRLRPCDRRRFTHRVQLADWNSRSKSV